MPPVLILLFIALLACETGLRDQIELFVQVKNSGIVYVDDTAGSDDNPGSQELPKKTIQKAVDLAVGLMERGKVHVAEGTYTITATLVVREGISIYGGFDPQDGWSRNFASNPTILQGSNIDTVIEPEGGVTPATVIDGFEIRAASEATAACIWCRSSSPTIRFNTLDAANGITNSIGVFNQFCSPVIIANTINAGQGSGMARGILSEGASALIWSNVIYGIGDNGTYIGISCNDGSDAVIQNNTIRAGTSVGGIGIYCGDSNVVIENNILFTDGTGCAVEEDGTAALPVRVNKNDFFACSPVYEYDGGFWSTVTDMETYLTGNSVPAAGNLAVDPDFVDQGGGDWHLSGGVGGHDPIEVTEGVSNPPISFSIDRDGLPRTDPWSIGAYEKD